MANRKKTTIQSSAVKSKSDKKVRFDHDGLWKDLIEKFFCDLLNRALPELYAVVDIKRAPRFLDKEFRDILNTGDPEIHTSPYFADYIIEVPLKNGDAEWILLHIEAQGPGGGSIAERMFHYQCLIYGHFRRHPVALVIITDKHQNEPRFYEHSHFGTENLYRYNSLVLAELDDEELLASDNPFDLALYAAKVSLRVKEELQKYNYLRTLTGLLAERGWDRDKKRDLMLFIMRIIYLNDELLEAQYWEYRQELDREGKLVYEPFLKKVEERMAEKRGEQRGEQRGKEEMAKNLLADGVPPDIIAKSAGLPVEKIQALIN
ncbi:MAG: hypothetical protein LBR61_05605 [Synergistaceae bacterium]|jgi:predicted transposase/invertase (TIGR01784 family)|nr:hypothetical protein [Synergistaceae bacterium]